jgi:hypothetical protein
VGYARGSFRGNLTADIASGKHDKSGDEEWDPNLRIVYGVILVACVQNVRVQNSPTKKVSVLLHDARRSQLQNESITIIDAATTLSWTALIPLQRD